MGTQGFGRGLDDEHLEPVWGETERNGLVVFLYPLYSVLPRCGEGGITDTLCRSLLGSRSRLQACVLLFLGPLTQHTEGDLMRF
jgi:hypothetical protein